MPLEMLTMPLAIGYDIRDFRDEMSRGLITTFAKTEGPWSGFEHRRTGPTSFRPSDLNSLWSRTTDVLFNYVLRRTDLGKCTHQCDKTQGNNSAQSLSTTTVFSGCKKIDKDMCCIVSPLFSLEKSVQVWQTRPRGSETANARKQFASSVMCNVDVISIPEINLEILC